MATASQITDSAGRVLSASSRLLLADETAHQAVDAAELRISLALVDTVIRDLFGVGLTLLNATSSMDEPARSAVSNAVDGIDGVIRTIREIAFDLHSPPLAPSASQ